MRRPWPTGGCRAKNKKLNIVTGEFFLNVSFPCCVSCVANLFCLLFSILLWRNDAADPHLYNARVLHYLILPSSSIYARPVNLQRKMCMLRNYKKKISSMLVSSSQICMLTFCLRAALRCFCCRSVDNRLHQHQVSIMDIGFVMCREKAERLLFRPVLCSVQIRRTNKCTNIFCLKHADEFTATELWGLFAARKMLLDKSVSN